MSYNFEFLFRSLDLWDLNKREGKDREWGAGTTEEMRSGESD
jgi:hypothetical protein